MKTSDFNLHLNCCDEARRWGQSAGTFGEPESTNPYPPGSYFSRVWLRHRALAIQRRNNELAAEHELEFAERCLREGDICGGEERLDAAEEQRGWWERFKELIWGASE